MTTRLISHPLVKPFHSKLRLILRKIFFLILLFTLSQPVSSSDQGQGISFTENRGQWENFILYRSDLPNGALFLENNAFTYLFHDDADMERLFAWKRTQAARPVKEDLQVHSHAFRMEFMGGNMKTLVTATGAFPDYKNFYVGRDPGRWATKVRHFQKLHYADLYAGTSLEIAQEDGRLKYSFYLKPGADPGEIQLKYSGLKHIRVNKGKLILTTSVNEIRELEPLAWQERQDGSLQPVICRYRVDKDVVSFAFPGGFDSTLSLVIDPVLVFSSYSGSTADNWGYTATYDQQGFLYAGGAVFNNGYPYTLGAFQTSFAGGICDIAISKYDTTGSLLKYSTYLGGSENEVPNSLIVDQNNTLYVMACTGSDDFPTSPGAFDNTFNGGQNYTLTSIITFSYGSDIALSHFSSDGTSLIASTFVGGSRLDGLNISDSLKKNYADDARGEIKLDSQGNVCVTTSTFSPDFPGTSMGAQPMHQGAQDGILFKMGPGLDTLLWATFIGGTGSDAAYSLAIGNNDHIYVAGGTCSTGLIMPGNTYQNLFGGGTADGFISCYNAQGTSLLFNTYYGQNGYDQVYFVDTDKQGMVYVLGQTSAGGMSFIQNASWATPGGGQFISKFSPGLTNRITSTAFGTGSGGPDISPTAFMVDICDNIYMSGWGSHGLNGFGGTSGLPLSANAFQTSTDNSDYYFMIIDGGMTNLMYGSFFGGSSAEHVDGGTSRFDKKGRIYQSVCAGCGGTDDFPTTAGAWSNINPGPNCNNGVIKFDFAVQLTIADFHLTNGCVGDSVFFQNNSLISFPGNVIFHWDFGDGGTSTLKNPVHVFSQAGLYNVQLVVTETQSCNVSDTIMRPVIILGDTSMALPQQNICLGGSVQVGVPYNQSPGMTFNWAPPIGLSNTHIPDPVANPANTTLYSLFISNGDCVDTLVQKVRVFDLHVNAGNDTLICGDTLILVAHASEDSLSFIWSSDPAFSDTLNLMASDSMASVQIQNQNTWFYVKAFNDYCQAIDSVLISFSLPTSPAVGNNPSCPDSCDGSVFVTVLGGIPPFTYNWNTGSHTDTLTGLCAGTYTVTVTDSAACLSVASITLQDPAPLVLQLSSVPVPCEEVCNGQASLYLSGGTPPLSVSWQGGQSTLYLINLCNGNYPVTVTDSNGCKATGAVQVQIENILNNLILASDRDTIYQGEQVTLTATGFPNCLYHWSPAASLATPWEATTSASPGQTTTYVLTITDPFGCTFIDSVIIHVIEVSCREPFIYIPNAFSPNGDHQNETIGVYGDFIKTMTLSIYDRWGEKVFETNNADIAWDGTFRGALCEPGVYVYYLEVRCYTGEVFKKKGNISLLR